jgi:hypothetical protein
MRDRETERTFGEFKLRSAMSRNKHLRLAGRPADYQKSGIAPVEVAQFEDGQRIGRVKRPL